MIKFANNKAIKVLRIMAKLVSIVLPVYNGQKYLAQSIQSVLNQTYETVELIIVNDCSVDDSLKIAQDFANKDSRVKIITNEQNQKLPESLNIGFRNANGDYYSWTSDDNYYAPTAIEEMVNFLENKPEIDLICCEFEKIDENDNFLDYIKIDSDPKNLIKGNTIGACFLYRKEAADKVGEYNKDKFLVEDYDYWLRLALKGKTAVINKKLYTYRLHSSSLTTTREIEVANKTADLLVEYLPQYLIKYPDLLKDKSLKKAYYRALKRLYFETADKSYRKKISKLGISYKIRGVLIKNLLKKIQRQKEKQAKFERDLFSSERLNKALNWIEKYTINNSGIAVASKQPVTIYPEVTGYYIPTLLKWGETQRAKNFADYLLTIQNEDGSWNDPSGQTPYTFDTGQILKGLWEYIDNDEKYKTAFFKGCDWILTQQREDDSIATPNISDWGLPFGKCVPEAVHIYCLEPIKKAGEKFGIEKYNEFVEKALNYYLAQDNLTEFDTLSHFHAYIIEGLIDIGNLGYSKAIETAKKAMDEVAKIQKKDGSIPAYPNVKFVCSTGLFQYTICWYKLGDKERGDRALNYAMNLQNPSGGFYGTYGKHANYFEKSEISWAVKYFLDAIYYRKTIFNNNQYEERLTKEQWAEHYNVAQVDSLIKAIKSDKLSVQTREILKITPKGSKTLEIASGSGQSSICLALNGVDATALDFEQKCLDLTSLASSNLGVKVKTICTDATQALPFGEREFDYIFHAGLLEHFTKEERINLLKLWRPYCKTMVSMVPNASSLAYRVGKSILENEGKWQYGIENPLYTQIDEFIKAGYNVSKEYTIGAEHALNFLPMKHPLRKTIHNWLKSNLCGDNAGQGYLLVTIGENL